MLVGNSVESWFPLPSRKDSEELGWTPNNADELEHLVRNRNSELVSRTDVVGLFLAGLRLLGKTPTVSLGHRIGSLAARTVKSEIRKFGRNQWKVVPYSR